MAIANFKAFRFLVIDDFANMRTMMKSMLQSLGAEHIDQAGNGRDAIDRILHTSYDVILCDYNLGDSQNGQQLLEEAKHRKLLRHTTVFVMITAENTQEMVMGAMEYRPDDYLTKPFNKDLLGHRVKRLIMRKMSLSRIDEAVERGEYTQAIAICDELIAARPRNLNELRAIKVDLCINFGNYDEARQVAEAVLAERNLPWAMVAVGRINYLQQNYDAAYRQFAATVEQHPTFTEAYDWLARTLDKLDRTHEAQQVLEQAVELSPNAILRQERLAELARRNDDLTTAERSYRKAVSLGRHSVYRKPEHYTGLAKTQAERGSVRDAMKTLKSLRQGYGGDPQAKFEGALAEGSILTSMGRAESAQKAFKVADELYNRVADHLAPQTAMAFAASCLQRGDTERGKQLLQEVVRNYHEEPAILSAAQQAFADAGMADEGSQLIATARGEVLKLNNQGVLLAKKGQLDAALKLFEKAAARMSRNVVVNLNAAQVMLVFMQKRGVDEHYRFQVRQYLQRVGSADPSNITYQKLLSIYEKMFARRGRNP